MRAEYKGRLNEIQTLWNNGFRGSGPDGRIILRDNESLGASLKKASSNTSDKNTVQTTQSQSQSQQLQNIQEITQQDAQVDDNHVLSKEDFTDLRRRLNIESKRVVPHY